MTKANFEEFTKKRYGSIRGYGKADLIRINKIVQLVGGGNKVLDVGCYYGFLGELLKENGNEVYGVDIAKEALQKTKTKGIKTKYADLEKKIPFKRGFFDVVVAAEVIEHLKDTDLFLEEIYRVLKPGGFLVITTSNLVSFGRRIAYLFGRDGYHEASYSFPEDAAGHLRYFNKELLIGLLRYHHFKIVKFTSDVVNFTPRTKSRLRSTFLAEILPTLGRSLIVKMRKNDV